MIRLLLKFLVSKSLDDAKPLPPSLRRRLRHSGELCRFAQDAETIGQTLKASSPENSAPPWLHQSIMMAIMRSDAQAAIAPRRHFRPLLLAASVATLIALLAGVAAVHFTPSHPRLAVTAADAASLSMAGSALEMGGGLIRQAPHDALAPLSDEMQRLQSDLDRAQRFLLTSLP
jgi:hypothetical protein